MSSRMLIIGPAWVGDTVMAQSLFKVLKQTRDVRIDVLAPAWTFPLLSRMPEVEDAIPMPLTHGQLKLWRRFQIGRNLKQRAYDEAIVLPNSFKSAIIPWAANIPKRTGWLGEWRYLVLNDIRKNKKSYPLLIEQYMSLGLPSGVALPDVYPNPKLVVPDEARLATLEKIKPLYSQRPILALCPGAEFGPSKRWPEKYYAEVAKQKIDAGWDVWIFGSAKDKPVADTIMQLTDNRCDNLAGRTTLDQSIDLLSQVTAVVTNDSGLMHIAAALDKPLIALYGSTSPAFTPPLSDDARILKLTLPCQPCFKRTCPLQHHQCMQDLKPDQVIQVMAEWGR